MSNASYSWIPFHMEFADKLLPYRDDRHTLISKVQAAYARTGMKFPKMEADDVLVDIDPFTIFGLFDKSLTDYNRGLIISELKNEFDVAAPVPSDFDGIPVVNPQLATFFYFRRDGRGEDDIENLWDVFAEALAYADNPGIESNLRLTSAFDKAEKQRGIKWNLTMGLYWFRPYSFINLDGRNRWFMSLSEFYPQEIMAEFGGLKEVPTGAEYLRLCELSKEAFASGKWEYSTIPEFSHAAWLESERVNQQNKEKAAQESALGDADVDTPHYWLYAPGEGACMWDDFYERGVMGLGWRDLGDLNEYDSKEAMRLELQELYGSDTSQKNSAHAVWQFCNDIKPGDIVFAKCGRYEILGRGVVEGKYWFDEDADDEESYYPHLRNVKWDHRGSWHTSEMFAMKTLTDITDYPNLIEEIESFFEDDPGTRGGGEPPVEYPPYSEDEFLSQVYMSADRYRELTRVLRAKKNIILQGAPGVGKTFAAKRLAYSMLGVKDAERVMMVQFHQSYSYEDFIEGYRPSKEGFSPEKGSFYKFCERARDDFENEYFFIIDEINRGNLSKIFGELFMLIESDKRGPNNKVQLLYSEDRFHVPENVFIIGMMNTADRRLSMLDYALRRRFAFFDLEPAFQSDGFRAYLEGLGDEKLESLIRTVEQLNEKIADDDSLGEGFRIGHSYFCDLHEHEYDDSYLSDIVEYELIPTLKEYWFDDRPTVEKWIAALRNSIR